MRELYIFDDADDFVFILGLVVGDVEVAADGIARGKQGFGDVFTDDGHVLRGGCVLRTEGAAGEKRDLHDFEVAVADDVLMDADVFVMRHALDEDGVTPTALVKGECGKAGGLDARQSADARLDLLKSVAETRVFGLETGGVGVDLQAQDVLAIEAGVDAAEVNEAAQEESGADHENQGESDLGDDEPSGKETLCARGAGSATILEGVGEMEARGAEGGDGAEEDGGGDGESEGEAEQAKIEADIERESFEAAGDHAEQQPVGGSGEGDAERAADQGEDQALGKELPDDARAPRTERLANSKFACACGRAGEQEIGDVGAGDEQDQRNDGHEDLQRLREFAPQRREAVGHGGERDVRPGQLVEISLAEVRIGEAARDLLQKQVDVGGGPLHGDAGFETAHEVERLGEVGFVGVPAGRDGFGHGHGNPDVRSLADFGAEELRRGDADDIKDGGAKLEFAIENVGVAGEGLVPVGVADNDDRMIALGGVVCVGERATELCLNAQHGEICAGNQLDMHEIGFCGSLLRSAENKTVDVDRHAEDGGDIGEDGVLLLQLAIEGIGVELGVDDTAADSSGVSRAEQDELAGFFTGSERSMTASIRLKMAVLAPMPSASESSATMVTPGERSMVRNP